MSDSRVLTHTMPLSRRSMLWRTTATGIAFAAGQQARRAMAQAKMELHPELNLSSNLPKVGWSLAILRVQADARHDVIEMTEVSEGLYAAQHHALTWADKPSILMQRAIIDAFRQCEAISVVGSPSEVEQPDLLLRCLLETFNLVSTNDLQTLARVTLGAKLVRATTFETIGERDFDDAEMPGWGQHEEQAFNRAVGHVLDELVPWTVNTGRQALQ